MQRDTGKRAWLKLPAVRGNKLAVFLYVVFFAILLSRMLKGVGQYWDWTFPYYSDQIGMFFSRASEAWVREANGSPLGYSSDYFVRWVVSLFRGMTPELLLFVLMLGIFTAGAYGVYLIGRQHVKPWIAFLLGLAAFVNPTIFYKFTAGHIDYLLSYVLIIYLAYYLLYRFRPTMRSAVIVGLMLALIGMQIQFFVIAGLLIALFFFFRPDQWRWAFLAPLLLLPLLVNAVWLSNFAFGGADIASISGEANKSSFKGASSSDYLNIFSFSFSKATLISRFYGFYELLLYGLIFALVVLVLLRARRKQTEDILLLVFLLLMLFLATGLFQVIELGPLTTLYPMFREVGHFAPVLVLVMILLLARLMPRGLTRGLCVVWLLLVIGISFVKFQANTQSISFASAREQFAEFKQFGDAHPDPNSRVLSYPFFDQYAFTKFPMQFQDNLPLRNSGHDSLAAYNTQQFIKNAIKPQNFKMSVQYRLLRDFDISVLEPYNVRYIYDFSSIYESYYERYVPSATYDNELGYIKNNPNFFAALLDANPGRLKRVSPHILEVVNYTPRIAAADTLYRVATNEEGEDARAFMGKVFPKQAYNYVADEVDKSNTPLTPGAGEVTPLFAAAASGGLVDTAQKSLKQQVAIGPKTTLYTNRVPSIVTYQSEGGIASFYASSSGKLFANGELVQDNDAAPPQLLGQIQLQSGQRYYAGIDGAIVPLLDDNSATVGRLHGDALLELYASAGSNVISNASFESGLWSSKVGDCNAYDDKPDIAMKQTSATASAGQKSLELSARRHDACTSTSFQMKGDTAYLLDYDYQSPNAQTASFYLRFNDSDTDAIKRLQSITDNKWHTATQMIITPDGATTGQLFLHALGSDKDQAAINRYDNVRLTELQGLGHMTIAAPDATYEPHTLDVAAGEATFTFTDTTLNYGNAIRNGSFEDGLWRSAVEDCNKYDKSPKLGMSLNQASKSNGDQSLQLEATRHVACTYTNATVTAGSDYILSFDYQGDPAQQAGFYAKYDGSENGQQERITIEDRKWHTFSTKIRTPELSTSMRLFLHAFDSNGSAKNVVRFDNVKLIPIPSVDQQFYVVSAPQQALQKPERVLFQTLSSSRRSITVQGARGPFVLSLSESYHHNWRLELDNARADGELPGAKPDVVGDHFRLSGYSNGWHVDPAKLCANNAAGCTKRADGSYDIKLIAEFVPQRWFVVNRAISVGTLMAAGGYLAVTHRRSRRQAESEGRYVHPLLSKRRKK